MDVFDFYKDEYTKDLAPKEEVQRILAPYQGKLCYTINSAWLEWMNDIPESSRRKVDSMSRGGVIHNFAKHYARKCFLDREEEGVRVCNQLSFFKVFFGNKRVVLRFKKLKRDHTVCLAGAKQQAFDWFWNKPISGIPKGSTRLTVGYVLNAIETEIDDIVVSSQVGDQLNYSFSIQGESTTLSMPTTEIENEEFPKVRIFAAGRKKRDADEA